MTRKLVTIDRVAGIVVALLLIAGGLVLMDWKLERVLSLPTVVRLSGLLKTSALAWWPLATAILAVLLILLGLRWLVAHLPRVRTSEAKLGESSGEGRIRLDTASVARASASALQSELVLPEARGRVREVRGRPLVQLDARCFRDTSVAEVRERAERVAHDIAHAFPSGDLPLRVVVGEPRRKVRDRTGRRNAQIQ